MPAGCSHFCRVATAGQEPGLQILSCLTGEQPSARTFRTCLCPVLAAVSPLALKEWCPLSGAGDLLSWLTALPFRVAEFQVPAGASGVLAGALGAADALNLVVEGLECGIHLGIMLSQVAGCLVCPHVLHGVRAFLPPAEASKG